MRFEKWQALGNDYVIVEADALPLELTPERVRRICEPHFGHRLRRGPAALAVRRPRHVAELRIFNPDGSEAELSGNGAGEAVLYLRRAGWTDADELLDPHHGRAGSRPTITGPDTATWRWARASVTSPDFPSGGAGRHGHVERGRARVELPARLDRQPAVRDRGRRRARGARPGRDRPRDRAQRAVPQPHQRLVHPGRRRDGAGRIFERGVGETLSSGTGACGAAVAAVLRGAASPITVELDGGELRSRSATSSRCG